MIESKLGQRVFGLIFFLFSAASTVGLWYTLSTEGYYYPKLAAIGPGLAVISLCLLVFPMDMEKFRAEHGVAKPQKMAHYPVEWQVMIVLAIAAGLGNWFAMSQM